jgi:glutathione S-transferase
MRLAAEIAEDFQASSERRAGFGGKKVGTMRILGRVTSINARKVLWAADEMGLAYEHEIWGKPDRDPNVPEFLAMNPNGQVPVLIDGDLVLWESNAILRYLAEKTASDLLPHDAGERALVDQWLTWQATELNFAWSYVGRARLRNYPPNPDPARIAESIAAWTRMMQILEGQLEKGGGYVVNGRFSLADIVIGLSTHRWKAVAFDKPELPAVDAHYAKILSRPAGKPYLGATTP